ncbi:MAG: hypothetical protein ACYC26_01505 [Phycisphaerales bacterium]
MQQFFTDNAVFLVLLVVLVWIMFRSSAMQRRVRENLDHNKIRMDETQQHLDNSRKYMARGEEHMQRAEEYMRRVETKLDRLIELLEQRRNTL